MGAEVISKYNSKWIFITKVENGSYIFIIYYSKSESNYQSHGHSVPFLRIGVPMV